MEVVRDVLCLILLQRRLLSGILFCLLRAQTRVVAIGRYEFE